MADLRERRLALGLTLAEMAKKANTTAVTIWRYECGQRKPSVKVAKRLAPLYGIKWEDFFKDDEHPEGA